MNYENEDWTKNTDVTKADLICGECGMTLYIYHVSNHHDGTGIFYSKCIGCEAEINVPFKTTET